MKLDFWFEFASTYSYPAAMRIEALAAERGVAVSWRAFLLGPIFRAQGWEDSPFNIYPAKGHIAAPSTVARCLAEVGQDADAILEEAGSPASKDGLRAQTQEAARLGIFGAPSFLVHGELFWGHDRLADALSWAVERAA